MRRWLIVCALSLSATIAGAQRRVEVEGEGDARRYVHHWGEQTWVYASQIEHDRTRAFLRAEAERRVAHPPPRASATTDAERAAQDAQLPWTAPYVRTCRRFHRAEVGSAAASRAAESGARIARGVTDPHAPEGAPLPFVDAVHPGHPLVRVRARFGVDLGTDGAIPSIVVGSHRLTTYPDGGARALAPDHPLVTALARFEDGDCVLVTGHVLGAYTTGHFDYDREQMACGASFWTRIDAIEACATP